MKKTTRKALSILLAFMCVFSGSFSTMATTFAAENEQVSVSSTSEDAVVTSSSVTETEDVQTESVVEDVEANSSADENADDPASYSEDTDTGDEESVSSTSEEDVTEDASSESETEETAATSEDVKAESETEEAAPEKTEEETEEVASEEEPEEVAVEDVADEEVALEVSSTESYILENANRTYIGNGDTLSAVNFMKVKQTMVDGNYVTADDDIDSIMTEEDATVKMHKFMYQFEAFIMLYETSEDSEYMVGFANTMQADKNATVRDWDFAMDNLWGEVLEGCIYDKATGLVYIPKNTMPQSDEGDVFGYAQVQLLQVMGGNTDVAEEQSAVAVDVNGEEAYVTTEEVLDLSTTVQVVPDEMIGDVSKSDIELYVNDIPYDEDMYDYNKTTGEVTVDMPSAVVSNVSAVVEEKTFTQKLMAALAPTTWVAKLLPVEVEASAAADAMEYVFPEIDPLPLDRSVTTDDIFYGETTMTYTTVDTSGMARGILYNYGTTGTAIAKQAWGELGPGILYELHDARETIGQYFFTRMFFTLKTEDESKVFDTYQVMPVGPEYQATFTCSHVTNPLGNYGYLSGEWAWVGICARCIELDWDQGYAVVAFATQQINTQTGFGLFKIKIAPSGTPVTMEKEWTDESLVENNDCYSLDETKFEWYGSDEDGNINYDDYIGCFIIGEDGKTKAAYEGENEDPTEDGTLTLSDGTYYYIEETLATGADASASPADKNPVKVTIDGDDADETTGIITVETENKPANDPVVLSIKKTQVGNTGEQPDLSGAEFTITHYGGYYSSEEDAEANYSGDEVTKRTWTFQTVEQSNGGYYAGFNIDGSLIKSSSDDLYMDGANDKVIIPLGTIVIKETKAPSGFSSEDVTYKYGTKSYTDELVIQFVWEDGAITRKIVDGTEVTGDTVEIDVEETEKRGGLSIEKWDKVLGRKEAQGDATLEGAVFEIINNNDNAVTGPDGKTYAKGETVMTITTDEDGNASTGKEDLQLGSYIVKEKTAPTGYQNTGTTSVNVKVSKAETITKSSSAIENNPVLTPPTIQKWDADIQDDVDKDGNPVEDGGVPYAEGDKSLKGATYTVTNRSANVVKVDGTEYQPGEVVATMTTDENGTITLPTLPYGTYDIQETKASEGYKLDTKVHTIKVRTQNQNIVIDSNEPDIKGGFTLRKNDQDRVDTEFGSNGQGDATDMTTTFKLINKSKHAVKVDGTIYAVGATIATLTTESDGTFTSASDYLPYGTYEIAEVTPPTGYTAEGSSLGFTFKIREDGVIVSTDTDGNDMNYGLVNEIIRGGLAIYKQDKQSGTSMPEGGASLAATFSIVNSSKSSVYVNGSWYDSGAEIMQITTDAHDGSWTSEADTFPYGTYTVTEVKAPTGYYNSNSSYTVEIREDGVIYDMLQNGQTFLNQVFRADFYLQKKAEGRSKMAYVPFLLTAYDQDGNAIEWHLLVADENGIVSTAAETHSVNTNAFDECYDEETGTVDFDKIKEIAASFEAEYQWSGVWFGLGLNEDGSTFSVDVDDSLNALPFGRYSLEEIKVDGLNSQYEMIVDNLTIRADGTPFDFGTVDNDSESSPKISTIATDESGDKEIEISEDVVIVDTVTYQNLDTDTTYKLVATLMDKTTTEEVVNNGEAVTAESKEFTPKDTTGTITVEIPFDATVLKGEDGFHDVVVFEELLKLEDGEWKHVTEHKDLEDDGQTLTPKGMGTTAVGKNTGTHEIPADEEVTIVDTIVYTGLKVGTEYTITGTLYDKDTGSPFTFKGATKTETFTPEESDGTYTMEFTFNASELAGEEIVVFENIQRKGKDVLVHNDLKDKDQTVRVPKIGTTATDKNTKTHVASTGETTIIDVVSYSNLTEDGFYTMVGQLMDSDGNKVGNEVTQTFTAGEGGEGTVTMEFPLTAEAGKTYVVYERCLNASGEVIGRHENPNDEGQTVRVPDIGTTATDTETETHTGHIAETVTIQDAIEYSGLIAGKTYTVKGTLYDKETGEALLGANGKEVTASDEFTAEASSGTWTLNFVVDSTLLAGKSVVAFEDVYDEDVKVASHAVITDEDQTVHFPEIGTTAIDKASGTHMVTVGSETVIVDTVKYENLVVGETYTLKGILVDAEGNDLKATCEPVTFEAKEASGSVDMTFTLDTTALTGKIVAYEYLYAKNGTEITKHENPDDEDQTVTIIKIGTNAVDEETNNHTGTISQKAVVVDEVTYSGLTPNKDYVMKGTLMDKSTKKAVKGADGKEITAEEPFTASKTGEGTVTLKYTVDSTLLAGKTVVVFENLYRDDVEIASHAEIDDEDQSVHYPKIGTKATVNGNKTASAGGVLTIKDTVTYENLIPNQKYVMSGQMMDKSTQKAVSNVKEVEFTADESGNGTVDVEFKLTTDDWSGKSIVAYEELYSYQVNKNGEATSKKVKVTEHKDINDEDQTVTFGATATSVPRTSTNVQTDDIQPFKPVAVIFAIGLAALAVVLIWRRKKQGIGK